MNLIFLGLIYTSCLYCTKNNQKSGYNLKKASIMTQSEQKDETLWWKKEAEKMVNRQIVARGIKDKRVINVMKNTPRHLFVPASIAEAAYEDRPLSIGEGQTISQPYIVAIM